MNATRLRRAFVFILVFFVASAVGSASVAGVERFDEEPHMASWKSAKAPQLSRGDNITLYLFASPNGNDKANGTRSAPVRTIPRAIALAQEIRHGDSSVPVAIILFSGVFPLEQTLEFGPAESNLFFVTFDNAAPTILSGGHAVDLALVPNTVDTYSVYLPATTFPQEYLWQIWSLAEQGLRRRFLNPALGGTARYDSIQVDGTPVTITTSGDVKQGLSATNLSQAFAYVYHSWTSSLAQVGSFNATTGKLAFATSMPDNVYNTASGRRFRVVNARPFNDGLLEPGCFFFDRVSRELVYRADANDKPVNGSLRMIVPRLKTLIRGLPGNANVSFAQMTLAVSDSYLEDSCLSTSCDGQSATALTTAAVTLEGVSMWFLQKLNITHHGGFGVFVRGGSKLVKIANSSLFDLGAGAVRFGEPAGGVAPDDAQLTGIIFFQDNYAYDGGHIVESGPGVMVQQAAWISIEHNSIHDFYYTGVSVGWTWMYQLTSVHHIYVGKNHIFNIGKGRLSDMGCVYTLGNLSNTEVDNNVCHDVQSYGYGGNGLYTDQGSSGVVFINNIVYRVKDSSLLQHWGLDNVFVNNVLAFNQQLDASVDTQSGQFSALFSAQPENMPSQFQFSNNIVLLRNESAQLFIGSFPGAFLNSTFDHNCYWNAALNPAELSFPTAAINETFAYWQGLGKDVRSIVADPLFKNAAGYDFSALDASSPCLRIGFAPINVSDVGPNW